MIHSGNNAIGIFIYSNWESGGAEVDFFDVKTHVLGTLSAEDTIPHQFGCGKVCRTGRWFAGVVNEVPPCRDSNMVWVCFLWMEINDYASIHDSLIFGDKFDFIVSHDENRVSAFWSHFIVALCHSTKIFTKGCLPHLWCCRVMHKLLVTTDAFTSLGMDYWHRNLRNIEAGGGRFCFELCRNTYIWQICPNTLGKKVYGLLWYKVSITQPSFNRDKSYVQDPSRGRDGVWVGPDNVWVARLRRSSWGNNWSRRWIWDKLPWCRGHDLRETARYVVLCLLWMRSFTRLQIHDRRSISNPCEYWDIVLVVLSWFVGGIHPLFQSLCINLLWWGHIWC